MERTSRSRSSSGDGLGGSVSELSLDDVFSVLGEPLRRRTLYHLHFGTTEVRRLDTLAEELAASTVGPDDPEAVRAALGHNHLPHLAALDLVWYDEHVGKVSYCLTPTLVEWLEHAAYTELPESHPLIQDDAVGEC